MFRVGFHPFHMVSMSPWPIIGSLSIASMVINTLLWVNKQTSLSWVMIGASSVILVSSLWWRDVTRESTLQGCHSKSVMTGLYIGMVMFITSEVMFFFSFFYGLFFSSLVPDVELGMMWPPMGVQPIHYSLVPFLNTIILLSSGVTVTWMHHAIMKSSKTQSLFGGLFTVLLGFIFTMFQFLEFYECPFSMADSVYGSLFFIMTGFHGIHVIVGTIFLTVGFFRVYLDHFSSSHHVGFEMSAWYWHFVDVVWLFLFISLYWWGA